MMTGPSSPRKACLLVCECLEVVSLTPTFRTKGQPRQTHQEDGPLKLRIRLKKLAKLPACGMRPESTSASKASDKPRCLSYHSETDFEFLSLPP